jgi:hypothetical protein
LRARAFPALSAVACVLACHDLSSFSTASGGSYEGPIESARFVRAGLPGSSRMCLTIDTDHLQDAPGTLSTSDGLFAKTPLRSIPQLWQDPLSTLSFGEGRIQNAVYVAHGNAADGGAASGGGDVFVVISFMVSDAVEVRLLRGAPSSGGGPAPAGPPSLFGVFSLKRASGACTY